MREQPVITERDTETSRGQQDAKDREVKPVKPEIPQVQRHRRQCEKKGANQERARRPINAMERDTKNQVVLYLQFFDPGLTYSSRVTGRSPAKPEC